MRDNSGDPLCFNKYIPSDVIHKILLYLDDASIRKMALVNKGFKVQVQKVLSALIANTEQIKAAVESVITLITQSNKMECEGQFFFSCPQLNIFYELDPNGQFYFNAISSIVHPPLTIEKVCEWIINSDIGINFQGELEQTFLHFVINDSKATSILLAQKEININLQDCLGNTAFHYGVAHCKTIEDLTKLITAFCKKNFNFNLVNKYQETVIDVIFKRVSLSALNTNDQRVFLLLLAIPFENLLNHLEKTLNVNKFVFEKLTDFYPEMTQKLIQTFERNELKISEQIRQTQSQSGRFFQPVSPEAMVKQILTNTAPESHCFIMSNVLYQYFSNQNGFLEAGKLYRAFMAASPNLSHLQIIEMLLQTGDINKRICNGETLLHFFLFHGDYESVAFLIKQGANVNAQDKTGKTALHLIIDHGDLVKNSDHLKKFLSLVELFERNGFDFSLMNNLGKNIVEILLMKSIRTECTDELLELLCKLLCETYVNPGDVLKYYGREDDLLTQLINTYQQAQTFNANMQLFTPPEKQSATQVKSSILSDNVLKKIEDGMELKLDEENLILLPEEKQLLIKAYRIIGMVTHIELHETADEEDWVKAPSGKKYFYEDHFFLDFYYHEMKKIVGNIPLKLLVEKIIELGFDINTAGSYGQTLLHLFAVLNNAETITLLLNKGANPNAINKYDENPLYILIQMMHHREYRAFVKTDALNALLNGGSEIKFDIACRSVAELLLEDYLGYENSDEHIERVAIVLVNSSDLPLNEVYEYLHNDLKHPDVKNLQKKIKHFLGDDEVKEIKIKGSSKRKRSEELEKKETETSRYYPEL